MKTARLNIRLTCIEKQRLEVEAQELGVPVSELVRARLARSVNLELYKCIRTIISNALLEQGIVAHV